MLSWFNKAVDNSYEFGKLKKELEDVRAQNQNLQARLELTRNEQTNATPLIDFDRMQVFSIERLMSSIGVPSTIIGYYIDSPVDVGGNITTTKVVHEWTLYCNVDHHEKLVESYKVWKNFQKSV